MKYPWVLQIGVVTKVWWFLVFSGVVYVTVVTRAQASMDLDPAVSKLESWLMAHFEATLIHITNNHFKTLLKAIWRIYGPKTIKNSLKMAKMSQIVNFPEFLAINGYKCIKWERKVLETQFWYQKKALTE